MPASPSHQVGYTTSPHPPAIATKYLKWTLESAWFSVQRPTFGGWNPKVDTHRTSIRKFTATFPSMKHNFMRFSEPQRMCEQLLLFRVFIVFFWCFDFAFFLCFFCLFFACFVCCCFSFVWFCNCFCFIVLFLFVIVLFLPLHYLLVPAG